MTSIILPRKWRISAGSRRIILAKNANESAEHVVMKALLWALYLPAYPAATVEVRIGDRYKPDVVALDAESKPLFWGEAGQVGVDKIEALAKRYRQTHFAIAKWDQRLAPVVETVRAACEGLERNAPFDLIRFPPDSLSRFVDIDGYIRIDLDDLEWIRLS
jgi:hypothetical protein